MNIAPPALKSGANQIRPYKCKRKDNCWIKIWIHSIISPRIYPWGKNADKSTKPFQQFIASPNWYASADWEWERIFLCASALLRELSFPKKILTFVIHFIILHKWTTKHSSIPYQIRRIACRLWYYTSQKAATWNASHAHIDCQCPASLALMKLNI